MHLRAIRQAPPPSSDWLRVKWILNGSKSTLRAIVVKSQKIHYTRHSKNLKRSTLRAALK